MINSELLLNILLFIDFLNIVVVVITTLIIITIKNYFTI